MARPTDTRKPPDQRPFTWGAYLISVTAASATIVVEGLAIDLMLAANGVEINVGLEALASAIFAFVLMTPCILIVWRIGLVTLGHYLLGVMVLFLPMTLLTLSIYPLVDLWITPPPGIEGDKATFSVFVRLLRAAALAPVSIFVFWLVYHVWFRATPRR